jgi:xylan 1,4-beta-xylosidase
MVARAAKKVFDQVKASAAPNTPIIWSEYNATYMNQVEVTDSAFMGPWLANNIRESDGLTAMTSYWCFSDVFEEQGVVKTPFYGGYGLIAERGIPKAAFNAFELLHRLGDRRVAVNSDDALVTETSDGSFVVALWNYAEPGETVPPKTFHLAFRDSHSKQYRMQFVAPGSGSVLDAWKQMGSPAYPLVSQIQQLVKKSHMMTPQTRSIEQPVILGPQTLAVLEIGK